MMQDRQEVRHLAHNQAIVGSSPTPATNAQKESMAVTPTGLIGAIQIGKTN